MCLVENDVSPKQGFETLHWTYTLIWHIQQITHNWKHLHTEITDKYLTCMHALILHNHVHHYEVLKHIQQHILEDMLDLTCLGNLFEPTVLDHSVNLTLQNS